ncbi:hypothetical protein [Georgenia sp. MJ170]|uniref:hypothetical protein n=1 Tax=Georgenia sunbinii TaxID=3117728 RepID=UPI002F26ABA0
MDDVTRVINPEDELFKLPPLATPDALAGWSKGRLPVDDPRVALLLAGASAGVRRWCGWHIAPVLEQTLVVDDARGAMRVLLDTMRLRDVLEVDNAGQMIGPDRLDWSASGALELRHGGRFTDRLGRLRVRVQHGFHPHEAGDAAQVVLQAAALALSSPMGATREQAGQVAVSWATTAPGVSGGLTLLERDQDLLAPFRIT